MFNFLAKYVQRPSLRFVTHQPTLRMLFAVQAAMSFRPVRGIGITRRHYGGVPGLEIRPAGVAGPVSLLYLHGGGFTIGSAATHKWLVARLAKAAGCVAFVPDYRLAPEHPFPAAVDDAEAVFDDLAARGPVAVAGDSAGGNLALGLCVTRRPSKALLLSPVVDLSLSATSEAVDFSGEMLIPEQWAERSLAAYACDKDRTDPRMSPIYGDLSAAPAMLIQLAKGEMLEPHGRWVAEKVPHAQLEVTENVAHVWQLNAGWQREADAAVASAAAFLAG